VGPSGSTGRPSRRRCSGPRRPAPAGGGGFWGCSRSCRRCSAS
jgi:hypothetical protein